MRTPWSSSIAFLGMTLGVVSIVSVHLISASISTQLDRLVPDEIAGFTHFLHRQNLTADDYFELRRAWRRGELEGVLALGPLIDETTDLAGRPVRVIGVDLLNAAQVPRESQGGEAGDFSWQGVWVDETLVGQLGYPVNGVIEAPAGTLLADIGPTQTILDWSSQRLSYLGVRVTDPLAQLVRDLELLLPGFGAGFPASAPDLKLPAGWRLVSMAEQFPARTFGKSVLFNISALGLLALLVAWLLIYQVSVSWLRHLWPVFERLHVLGVEWQQLRRYFLAGMVMLGVLASCFGLVLGLLLAQLLLYLAIGANDVNLQLDAWVVLKGAGSAFVICLLGGVLAFSQAQQQRNYGIASLLVTVPALFIAIYCLANASTGLAGGFVAIAVLSLVSGFLASPLLKQLRKFGRFIAGPYLVRLGVREAIWYPQDVGVALAGLSLAVATAIGVGLMVDSFRVDFEAMLEHRLDYDLVAEGQDESLTALRQTLLDRQDVPEISRLQVYRDATFRVQGLPVALRVARVDQQEAQRYGDFPALASDQVLLSEQASQQLNALAGDVIETTVGPLTVVGVFSGFGEIQPRLIVDNASPLASYARRINSLGIKTAEPDDLLTEIRSRYPDLELRLQTDIRRTALETFDQTFAITRVLIAIALLVATLSVYIAITALRLNRPTGNRLLTTLGIFRREAIGIDFALGLGFGVIALLIALPLGLTFGWILCAVVNPRAFGWTIELQLVLSSLVPPLALGLGAALIACLLRSDREEGVYRALR